MDERVQKKNSQLSQLLPERVEKALLTNAAYRALPAKQRAQIAHDTVRMLQFLLGETAIEARLNTVGQTLSFVDFPDFVADLVRGTFDAIVDASIRQMEAYGELLKSVAKTIDQYKEDNISDQDARDYLVDKFPKHLEIDTSGRKKVKPKKGCSKAALLRCFADLGLEEPTAPLDDDKVEKQLLAAARRRMARDRQQLLGTMVLMGINRVMK